jgi:hypothetical protein
MVLGHFQVLQCYDTSHVTGQIGNMQYGSVFLVKEIVEKYLAKNSRDKVVLNQVPFHVYDILLDMLCNPGTSLPCVMLYFVLTLNLCR